MQHAQQSLKDNGEVIRDACSELSVRNKIESVEKILQLVRWAVAIECHYDKPVDVEWVINTTFDNQERSHDT